MSASNENSEHRRADGDESEEGGLTPALLEQVETRVMERLLARLTRGRQGRERARPQRRRKVSRAA